MVELWRYPVKSMQGEPLDLAEIGPKGIVGDRHWALLDVATGRALTARREPALLHASARLAAAGVEIDLPHGPTSGDDRELSAWLGRDVTLREATPSERGTYESPLDAEDEEHGPWAEWSGPMGSFHDSTRTRVSIVSTATIGQWDRRRFRANVVVDGTGEDDLVGQRARIGDAVVEVVKRIDRCVMVTRPQPGLGRDLDVLRTITRERGGFLAVGALVREPGPVRVGDELVVAD